MITQSGLGDYLLDAASMGASDLHITAGLPPMVRISGKVEPLDYPTLTTNGTRDLIYDLLSNDQRQRLENEWELDFSYALPRSARVAMARSPQRPPSSRHSRRGARTAGMTGRRPELQKARSSSPIPGGCARPSAPCAPDSRS